MHPILIQLLYSGWKVEVALLEKGSLLITGNHATAQHISTSEKMKGFEILEGTYHDIFWSRFLRTCQSALEAGKQDTMYLSSTEHYTPLKKSCG